jgi:Domain of unknown function (DUF1905)
MATIRFETTPLKIGDWTILRLPESASAKLPWRGMKLVEGTINGFRSKFLLEPDGSSIIEAQCRQTKAMLLQS